MVCLFSGKGKDDMEASTIKPYDLELEVLKILEPSGGLDDS